MTKTKIEDVSYKLMLFLDHHKLAQEWIKDDIIKKKIASTYDDWVNDHANQPEMLAPGLEAHVELCLIHPELIGAE
jgi:hypothetical protein